MSKNWDLVPLGELLTKSEEWIEIKATERYKQVTVKIWGKGVVQRNEVAGAEIAASKRLKVHSGQFILSRIDARHGAFGIIPDRLEGAVVTNDFPVFTANSNKMLPQFLNWMSKTASFIDICKAASEGTTNRVRLKEDKFLSFKIPLPLLEEQRRIVAKVEELAEKIEEARSLRKQTVKETKSFVTSLHLNLSGSRKVKLNKILNLDEHRETVEFGNEYPQVGVRGFGGGLFPKESINATQTSYKAFNRLYDGAIVLSQVKGWEGAISVCSSQLADKYVSPEYRTFSCIPEQAIPEYLAVLFAAPWFWTKLKNITRGMGGRRERTRPEQFLKMELPMPTVDQQRQALSVLKKLEPMQHLREKALQEIDELLPSILDKAFKGEL